jgi:hypothetical protein
MESIENRALIRIPCSYTTQKNLQAQLSHTQTLPNDTTSNLGDTDSRYFHT